jgi:hypothetical protein
MKERMTMIWISILGKARGSTRPAAESVLKEEMMTALFTKEKRHPT